MHNPLRPLPLAPPPLVKLLELPLRPSPHRLWPLPRPVPSCLKERVAGHALVAAQVERPARGRLLGRGRPLVEVPGVSLGAAGGAREA